MLINIFTELFANMLQYAVSDDTNTILPQQKNYLAVATYAGQ